MSKQAFLYRFTPSLMSAETLEAMFVQHHRLAEELVAGIRESVLTSAKHFRLLVGMRGIGKTHLVALVYHRVRRMEELQSYLYIAWLREEEWGVSSFLDLLLRIFRVLAETYPDAYQNEIGDRVEQLYDLSKDEAERCAEILLRDFVGDRTLLILAENLEDIFLGLGEAGQKQFRAYIQNYEFITILATARSLFNGVRLQTSPFYGLFLSDFLEALTLEDAIALLVNIAQLNGDEALEVFLKTPTGRARVRAIHHIAGGNPRLYVVFSQFLNRDSLDEPIELFMQTLDELTPYYQARMSWLSAQQRKIVEFLVERRSAASVKDIARSCFSTPQTISSQLKDLREKDYVKSESVGRESYYELSEPLMRFCLEVKRQRGETIRLFVDFLRVWYAPSEVEDQLESLEPEADLERGHLLQALRLTSEEDTPEIETLVKRYISAYEAENFEQGTEIASRLVALRGRAQDWFALGYCLDELGRYEKALEHYTRATELEPNEADAWYNSGVILSSRLERHEEAIEKYEKAIAIAPDTPEYWRGLTYAFQESERHEDAIAAWHRVSYLEEIRKKAEDASFWHHWGDHLQKLRQDQEALVAYEKAIALHPEDDRTWHNLGSTLAKLGRYQEALAAYEKAIALNPKDAKNWRNFGYTLNELGRYQEALVALEKAIALKPEDSKNWQNLCFTLMQLDRHEEALDALIKALELADYSTPVVERLVDVAKRYQLKGDRRILLELPIEERRILEPILGIES